MTPSEEAKRFRSRAADMRKMAGKARNERTKEELLVIAAQYERLAEGVEPRPGSLSFRGR